MAQVGDLFRTNGSPHGGNLYMGSLFHCGGCSGMVQFADIFVGLTSPPSLWSLLPLRI